MPTNFTPYPNYPSDPTRVTEVRGKIASIPRGPDFFDELEADPEMVAVYKTDAVRSALEKNAERPLDARRPERAIIEHQERVFSTYAGI